MDDKSEVSVKIDEFFANFRVRKYAKGQILLLNGDEASHIFHLVKGNVKQYDISYRGDELILNIFKPPAFFPMSLAINKAPSPYIFEAETDIEIHQVPAADAVAFLKDNPEVTYDLLSRVYRGVDGLLGRVVNLMASSAKNRLIYELILEARRFGTMNEDGSCKLTINEKDLGGRAGLSRETVSRIISKLKAEGMIDALPKGLLLKDLEALGKYLDKA